MKIGLFGDIHGNLAALEAVLRALERAEVDELVCLGDVAATGPQPAEVLGPTWAEYAVLEVDGDGRGAISLR